MATKKKSEIKLPKKKNLIRAFELMCQAKAMSELYEADKKVSSKYVHATSRGHEAIQIAAGMQLLPQDYVYPYYRDDAMLLSIGMQPYDLMLQLFAKKDDPFSGGRTYYSHPSLRDDDKPKIPHQSSATGMQAIPATGAAMGLLYKDEKNLHGDLSAAPIVICSLGDASITEGEVSEAFQMAALKQLPIIYLIQDNEWDISATAEEIRSQNAFEYAQGFKGLEAISIDGANFAESYNTLEKVIKTVREERRPFLIHASVPLLSHHTSGVRKEWYRHDLEEDALLDPYPVLMDQLTQAGISKKELDKIIESASETVNAHYAKAQTQPEPLPSDITKHQFAETNVTEEQGVREFGKEEVVMVDCALHAIEEIMSNDKTVLLYGQDVGHRLGGVFREAATLADKFGQDRVFNTAIQEAFIIGSTAGMSAVGLKPIVEVQFADYIWPGLNQLFSEVSRSCYLSNGKWPVNMILRVPIGAYGSGGPYHSGSVESVITNIKGIKIAYPSNGADMKGLFKAAYNDPNPVIMLEHKGLYWSKVPGTDSARVLEPDDNYVLPFGKARTVLSADNENSISIITYGMGVHWSLNAAKNYPGQVELVDLRTLVPLDEEAIFAAVRKTGKCLIVTEEPASNSFGQAIAGRVQEQCFEYLDGPVRVIGSLDLPAIPLNSELEKTMLPNADKVGVAIGGLLEY